MGLGGVVMLRGVGLCRDVEWGCGCRGVDGIAHSFYDCHGVGWDGMAVGLPNDWLIVILLAESPLPY